MRRGLHVATERGPLAVTRERKNVRLRITCAALGVASLVFAIPVLADPPGSGWTLVFADEFNGTAVDTSKWNTCFDIGCGNGPVFSTANNLHVGDGVLTVALRQDNPAPGYSWSSGAISSHDKFEFLYGYMETRARLSPHAQATNPAFWARRLLLPSEEIDVFETLYRPNKLFFTLHCDTFDNSVCSPQTSYDGPDFSANFHVIGAYWDASRVEFYVDGTKRGTLTQYVPQHPLYVIANHYLKANANPSWAEDTISFDYIRVWQQVPICPGCNDNDPCTADNYDPAIHCRHTPVTDGTACSTTTCPNGTCTCRAGRCVSPIESWLVPVLGSMLE